MDKEMYRWEKSRIAIPGLTLADRDFCRLVAITVCSMEAWELNVLGSRPIKWKRLPMAITVRPEWEVLFQRYGNDGTLVRAFYNLCIVEARKIMRIHCETDYA